MLNLRKHNFLRSTSLLGKLLRLPFEIVPDKVIIPILAGPLKGKKWIAGAHNKSLWLGTYERKQSSIFVQRCKGSKIFLDLGAHAGYYTLLYKSVNKKSKVYSFEPVEENHNNLKKHIDINSLTEIFTFKYAVADTEGVLSFARGNSVGGKLCATGDMEVTAVKLSRLLKEGVIPFPDLIKIDIEGAEYKVLKDLKAFLIEKKPLIFLSTHSREVRYACLELVTSLDYKIVPLDDNMEKAREFLIEQV